jgi:hypothetical protein
MSFAQIKYYFLSFCHAIELICTSIMAIWRFLVMLVCGGSLEFAAPSLYVNIAKAQPIPWNSSNMIITVLAIMLTLIVAWGGLVRNKKNLDSHKNKDEKIERLEQTSNELMTQVQVLKEQVKNSSLDGVCMNEQSSRPQIGTDASLAKRLGFLFSKESASLAPKA